jgi:predicted nucleic acid-binding protein
MSRTNYAWDSSVFIAWLAEEKTAPLGNIDMVVREIDGGRANLIFSVVTYTEILESKYSEKQLAQLDAFLRRSNVIKVDITIPVAKKAAAIRNAGWNEDRKIKTPDALILAVALLHKADVLHALDGGMRNLNGHKIVDGLVINEPFLRSGERSLFDNPS